MPQSRVARLAAAAAGVALLVLVAYLVAGSRGTVSDAWVGVPEFATDSARDLIVAVILLMSVLVVALVVRGMFIRARLGRPGGRNSAVFGITVLVLVVVVIWAIINILPEGALDLEMGEELGGPVDLPGDPAPTERDGMTGVFLWLVALTGAVGVWAFVVWRRGRRPVDEPDMPHTVLRRRRLVLAGLLDDAIARLRDHPDPREATIAAWARLETALEAVGVPRRDSDTPTTYMALVLEAVEASGPSVKRLTDAYERAMYSPHDIDRATQLQSVDALIAVRDELHVLELAGETVSA